MPVDFTNQIRAVGYCRTPYKQKFGIPRQPGLVDARGFVQLSGEFNHMDTIRGLEQYSHLWLLFCFHENLKQGWKTTVRPPRLGGNEKLGVFATRSTFRPNGIGQSVVKLHDIHVENGQISLEISGMDLLDDTPIIDIKPYVPFSDAITNANGGMAQEAPELTDVHYSELALRQITELSTQTMYKNLLSLIKGVLSQDPRPAYKKDKFDPKTYQVALFDLDIFWRVIDKKIEVLEIKKSLFSYNMPVSGQQS